MSEEKLEDNKEELKMQDLVRELP